MKKWVLIVMLLPFFFGCIPNEKKKSQAESANEAWTRKQIETIKMVMGVAAQATNQPVRVEIETDNTDVGNMSAESEIKTAKSIPEGVKLILIGVGIFVIILAFWFLTRFSLAARAGFRAVDNSVTSLVHRAEARMNSAATLEEKAMHSEYLADLNKHRGRVLNRK